MGDYKIQSGETLSSIAAKNGVSLSELKAANPNISETGAVNEGQEITIPLASKSNVDDPLDFFEKSSPYDDEDKYDTNKTDQQQQYMQKLLANGQKQDFDGAKLTEDKKFMGLLSAGTYSYSADGTMTYGQLKAKLGLNEEALAGKNPDETIPKGTTLQLNASDMPNQGEY